MIITKTPFRMSFFGGGSDIPEFFNMKSGAVLSTTIDKYCYTTVRDLPPFFEYRSEISYSQIERVQRIEEIKHPAVRNAMVMLGMDRIRLTYEADLPARTGLGTSSSFAVGLLNALHTLKKEKVSKKQLAEEAIFLERNLCKESGGWQDQVAASYGGLNKIIFENGSFIVQPLMISRYRIETLNKSLMLFFTGFTRLSSQIQKDIDFSQKIRELDEIRDLVDESVKILTNEDCNLKKFGQLLDLTWQLKRGLGNNVSNESIDLLYDRAKKAGAIGGKLLGAGGGGFLLLFVEPAYQKSVKEALGSLLCVPFSFENYGTQVIFNSNLNS